MNVLFDVLPYIAVLAGVAGVLVTAKSVFTRVMVERHYINVLRRSLNAEIIRDVEKRLREDGRLSEEELAQVIVELERLTLSLARSEREIVLAPLKQPSFIGRERYVEKLIAAAA